MTKPHREILLLEDTKGRQDTIARALKRAAKSTFQISQLEPGKDNEGGAYEDRLRRELESPRFKNLALIVTDRDLSQTKTYPGLSEAVVSKVAMELAIPVCVYTQGKGDSLLERQRSGGGGRILLESVDIDAMAAKVCVLAEGFLQIHEKVLAINKSKKRSEIRGPASVLASLLGAPEVVDQLALYTRGDQRMIASLTPRGHSSKQTPEDVRRVSHALGVWLYDSILRFPGVILGAAAAGSLLGIDQKAFVLPSVNAVFKEALYHGPFEDRSEPRWWRHRLVETLTAHDVSNGRDLVKRVVGKLPKPCQCSVDGKAPAGFLCVMTDKPVCDEHSVGQIGWLPRGADLARVRRDLYDQIGPWVGMS